MLSRLFTCMYSPDYQPLPYPAIIAHVCLFTRLFALALRMWMQDNCHYPPTFERERRPHPVNYLRFPLRFKPLRCRILTRHLIYIINSNITHLISTLSIQPYQNPFKSIISHFQPHGSIISTRLSQSTYRGYPDDTVGQK